MKQIKFLLSLAVALLIVVPVLAQDAEWGVSGDAAVTFQWGMYTYGADYEEAANANSSVVLDEDQKTGANKEADHDGQTQGLSVDNMVINVKLSKPGAVFQPYAKVFYDKGDDQDFVVGTTMSKGNFSGEAKVRLGDNNAPDAEIDGLNVTYTMGAVALTYDKGGDYGCSDSFKIKYTLSDTMSVYAKMQAASLKDVQGMDLYYGVIEGSFINNNADVAADLDGDTEISKAELVAYIAALNPFTQAAELEAANNVLAGAAGYAGANTRGFNAAAAGLVAPVTELGFSMTAGMIAANVKAAFAQISIQDTNAAYGDALAGESYMFFNGEADVTVTVEGISVKVYGGYGINLDSFGDDKGYFDDDFTDGDVSDYRENERVGYGAADTLANEVKFAALTDVNERTSVGEMRNAISMKFGTEIAAMGAKLTADFVMVNPALDQECESAAGYSDWAETFFMKQTYAVSYDLKIQDLTLTPKVQYVIYPAESDQDGSDGTKTSVTTVDYDKKLAVEGTDLDVTLCAKVTF